MITTIVLGYDGSPAANAALTSTIALARGLGARVVVVFGFYISPLGGGDVHDYKVQLERLARHEVGRAVNDLEAAGVRAVGRPESGKPVDVILAVAAEEEASLIVVGAVGEGPVTTALLGSVTLRLVQRAPVPVLVVPVPGSRR